MRKYRGKRVDNGEWVYGWYGHKEATDQHYIMIERLHDATEYGSYFVDVEVDPKTVGQSTGLKDKNGKEIYEGDILESDHKLFRFEVIWSEDWAMFTVEGDSVAALIRWATYCEVIGNSTDNPELLEV